MKVLITGRSGSGKSTICAELLRRRLSAFDGDSVPGLAHWIDTASGTPVRLDYGTEVIDRKRYHWDWDVAVLRALLTNQSATQADSDLFLCGSADNQLTFHGLFDRVFVLTLQPETQQQRLVARTSHNYGKHPDMQKQIITEQRTFVEAALRAGGMALDAEPPVSVIVEQLLKELHHAA